MTKLFLVLALLACAGCGPDKEVTALELSRRPILMTWTAVGDSVFVGAERRVIFPVYPVPFPGDSVCGDGWCNKVLSVTDEAITYRVTVRR